MHRLKRFLTAAIIASTIFLTASFGREPEEPPEEASTISPVLYDDSAELAELEQRKQAHMSELARAKAEEVTRKHHIAIEVRRLAAEDRRKQALLAKSIASKPKQPSRSEGYVGKVQTYEATFYTAFCPTGCTGVTASGYDVSNTIYYEGMRILAAPRHIPLYSIMRVKLADGSTFDGIVLDRGGDVGVGRLDILVSNRDEAYRNGRQSVEVRMIRKGR